MPQSQIKRFEFQIGTSHLSFQIACEPGTGARVKVTERINS
jgi:hypothetical protein